jgi:hypothetical protein
VLYLADSPPGKGSNTPSKLVSFKKIFLKDWLPFKEPKGNSCIFILPDSRSAAQPEADTSLLALMRSTSFMFIWLQISSFYSPQVSFVYVLRCIYIFGKNMVFWYRYIMTETSIPPTCFLPGKSVGLYFPACLIVKCGHVIKSSQWDGNESVLSPDLDLQIFLCVVPHITSMWANLMHLSM